MPRPVKVSRRVHWFSGRTKSHAQQPRWLAQRRRGGMPQGDSNMRAVQLTAYGDPLQGLNYLDIPTPPIRARTRFSSVSSFRRSTRATFYWHGASTERVPLFQQLSAMKESASFSLWGRECKTLSSATAFWRRSPALLGGNEWFFRRTDFSPYLLTRTRSNWRCSRSILRPRRCYSA